MTGGKLQDHVACLQRRVLQREEEGFGGNDHLPGEEEADYLMRMDKNNRR